MRLSNGIFVSSPRLDREVVLGGDGGVRDGAASACVAVRHGNKWGTESRVRGSSGNCRRSAIFLFFKFALRRSVDTDRVEPVGVSVTIIIASSLVFESVGKLSC